MMRPRLLLTITSIFLFTFTMFGQDVESERAKKREIEEQIKLIDSQIKANNDKKQENLQTLRLTRKKIEARKELIRSIDNQIKSYDLSIKQKNNEIEQLNRRLDTLTSYYEKLIYNSYKVRDTKIWFLYLLSSKDISQGLRRWSYLKSISETAREQAARIRDTKYEIQIETEKLKSLRLASLDARKEREMEYTLLTKEEKSVNSTIARLNKKEKEMKKELNKKKKEVERLNRQIEQILAAATKKTKSENKPADVKLSKEFGENKGKLPRPVKGVVTEPFGQNYHPVFKNIKMPFNNGINISCDKDSKVKSVFNGVVKQILVMPGYNQCVLVQHGDYFTFYCKLKMVNVKSGDKISTGDIIGIVDTDEESGNGELHFQLWKGTQKQNPEHWLSKK